MSEQKGKLITCDRCGEYVFVKLIGSESFDGGYDHADKFEEVPNDWGCVLGFGILCPQCADEAKKLVDSFMKG